jgi:phage tail sheath protein FI
MAAEQFLHGIEVLEVDDGLRPIPIVETAIIGLIGTAPDADPDAFPLDEPVAIIGNPRQAAALDMIGDGLGTLKDAIDAIFDQAGATVVVVRVEEGLDLDETMGNIMGDSTLGTGVWAFLEAQSKVHLRPKVLLAPGFTAKRMEDGITNIAMTQVGSGYDPEVPPEVTITDSGSPGAGAGGQAYATVNLDGQVESITILRSGSNYTDPVITIEAPALSGGVQATAEATIGDAANPVIAEMQGIADRLRAVILADGPNTTNEDAVTYREDWGSKRIFVIDPNVLVFDTETDSHVPQPTSGRVAGVISRMDNEKGFWWSPSNQILNGVTGISLPIEFNISDRDSVANYLNRNEVATVIRYDGFRLWGNRVTTPDPLWAFLSVRRTADAVYDSIERAFLWAIDRPFSAQLLVDIADSVNAFLRHLESVGAIIGGKAWLDPTLNTPDQLQQGKLYVDFDIEPPAPLEHLIFRAHRNGQYYEELVMDAIRTLETRVGIDARTANVG